jgi:hypothetical protein
MGVGGQNHVRAAYPCGSIGTHCLGDWVGLKLGLNGCGKFRHHRDSISDNAAPSDLSRYSDYDIPVQNRIRRVYSVMLQLFCTSFRCARYLLL